MALVAADNSSELALRTMPNIVRQDGPYPHFDAALIWSFLRASLSEMHRVQAIDAISITTHGAAGALISDAAEDGGLTLPIMDYEFTGPDDLAADYDAVRPCFTESLSPRMPRGLNLGAQLFWQERRCPEQFGKAQCFVTYPQYWAWRLCGVAANEITSLGSHTDLWRPATKAWSSIVDRLSWGALMAPIRLAFDRLGPCHPELARELGLRAGTPILCGIHDSNASLLPHLLTREPPFAVVSTGTWVIVLAVGGRMDQLDPARDGMAYVNALGDPVPAGRFMGGREFDRLTGGRSVEPDPADLDRVLSGRIMALPSFAPSSGPFPARKGRWTTNPEMLSPGERSAVASVYLALMTAECLAVAGAAGSIIIEGPFTANRIFAAALSAIAGMPAAPSGARTGTTHGAALLATGEPAHAQGHPAAVEPLTHPDLASYTEAWRRAVRAA